MEKVEWHSARWCKSLKEKMMEKHKIIDADAHMSEPGNLWAERADRRFKNEVPRTVTEYKGQKGLFFTFNGKTVRIAGGTEDAATDMLRPGGWDPEERLKDMAIDGVEAAVLYSTFGFFIFGTNNVVLQEECFRVYNDWLGEFCSYAPKRFAGLGMISLYDIQSATQELQRIATLGLKGAMITALPPDECPPYSSRAYDPFWAAAQDLNMVLSLHTNTEAKKDNVHTFENIGNWGPIYTSMVMRQADIQHSLMQIIFSGTLERFPGLKFIAAEGDINWVPGLMGRADKYYASRIRRGHEFSLPMLPSEYFHRQVWASFIKDPVGLKIYRVADYADRAMWSTDYPHPACFFPHSQDILETDFQGVPEEDVKKIVHDNVAQLFHFDL
jgi:predicted TIM-barrel fold metal-dependent hydrolase